MPTLSRNAVIALATLVASSAGADEPEVPEQPAFKYVPAYEFKRPAGLEPDHDLSMKLSEALLQEQHFGGLPATVVVDASVAEKSWAFYIFDISAADRAKQPEQIVRDAFDQLRTGSGDVVSWKEGVENNLATAAMEWRYRETQTLTLVQTNMWVTSTGSPHQLRAECIMHAESADEIRPKCAEAFAALTIKADDRGALGPLPTASKPAAQPREDPAPSASPSLRPPTEGAVVYKEQPKKTPGKDNTFLYVAGAILLIVAIYMAMRRGDIDDEESDDRDDYDDEEESDDE